MAGSRKLRHRPTDHARNYSEIAYRYAVEARKDRAGRRYCRWVRLAATRHLEDLKAARRKAYPFRFDEWSANDVCDFVEKFPHVRGDWTTDTIRLEPVQVFILACVFGWLRKADGTRRFRTVYVEMARKGAKSTLTAPVAHYCLTCDDETGPEIIIGATTGQQALKVFQPAQQMAQRLGDYRDAFGVEVMAKSIVSQSSGGFIQPINAKSSTQDGWNPHLVVLDELHAHKDRGLYDVMRSAFGARRNWLLWQITTAGYNAEGVCMEQHRFTKAVLEQAAGDRGALAGGPEGLGAFDHFGIIFTIDKGDDPFDESKWIKANPLLGITPTLDEMRSAARSAQEKPGERPEFLTKRLNVWTTARDGWLNMGLWDRCGGEIVEAELEGLPCWGGLDLASVADITAFVLVWTVDGRVKARGRYYVPEAAVELDGDDDPERDRKVLYQAWRAAGWLTVTPGDVTDYDFVQADIEQALEQYDVQEIGFDPWNAQQLVNALQEQGAPMVQLSQTTRTFNGPMRELERRIKSRTLDHGGDPVLSWMAANVVAMVDTNGNLKPNRGKSPGKIDGMVALLMALGRAITGEEEAPPTPWDADPEYRMVN